MKTSKKVSNKYEHRGVRKKKDKESKRWFVKCMKNS